MPEQPGPRCLGVGNRRRGRYPGGAPRGAAAPRVDERRGQRDHGERRLCRSPPGHAHGHDARDRRVPRGRGDHARARRRQDRGDGRSRDQQGRDRAPPGNRAADRTARAGSKSPGRDGLGQHGQRARGHRPPRERVRLHRRQRDERI